MQKPIGVIGGRGMDSVVLVLENYQFADRCRGHVEGQLCLLEKWLKEA